MNDALMGALVGLLGALLGALFGLLGTLAGSVITIVSTRTSEKLKEVFSLHREFSGDEMNKIRNEAFKLLQKYPDRSYAYISQQLSVQETNHLWSLIGFYQRLWLAIKYNNIDTRYVPELFGELIVWWYYFTFEERLIVEDWQASKDIKNLFEWTHKHLDSKEFEIWKSKGILAKDNVLAQLNNKSSESLKYAHITVHKTHCTKNYTSSYKSTPCTNFT